eukprot:GFYU01001865.1.p1 GENE.GFYU01001865.1~~GFYU01001865.1.p1  ORF type:complete len:506 (-),score=95.11 GFYU01001865.1:106-1623(-)
MPTSITSAPASRPVTPRSVVSSVMEPQITVLSLLLPAFVSTFGATMLVASATQLLNDGFGEDVYTVIAGRDFVGSLLGMMAAPVLGSCSDRFGRKPVVLLQLIGTTVPILILALTMSPAAYIVADMICTVFGPKSMFQACWIPVISDITTKDTRAKAYGQFMGAAAAALIVGPVSGGFMGKAFGVQALAFTACAVKSLGVLYVAVALPETRNPTHLEEFKLFGKTEKITSVEENIEGGTDAAEPSISKKSTWAQITEGFRIASKSPVLWHLLWISLFVSFADNGVQDNVVYYLTREAGLTTVTTGVFISSVGLWTVFVQFVLLGWMSKRMSEYTLVAFAVGLNILTMFLIAFITELWMVFAFIPFMGFTLVRQPVTSAIVSKHVTDDEQGTVQGIIQAITNFSSGIGPLLFSYFLTHWKSLPGILAYPGMAFTLASVFVFIGFCFSLHMIRVVRRGDDHEAEGIHAYEKSFSLPVTVATDAHDSGKTAGHDGSLREPLMQSQQTV